MANLLLTESCNRSCPYCFAKDYMQSTENDFLSWDDLIYVVDFLEASGEKRISLLGGEPTIHPKFVDFVKYLNQRGSTTNVFTNGIVSNNHLEEFKTYLSDIPKNKFYFTCNVNHPDICSEKELLQTSKFFEIFGERISLSLNVYKPDFDWQYAIDYIEKFNLKKHIRLGITHPIPGEVNLSIKKTDMPAMAKRIMFYIDKLDEKKISLGFDCGMPLCLFSDEDLGKLYKNAGHKLRFDCGIPVDIGPQLDVWSCFPLSNFNKKSIYDFDSLQEIKDFYNKHNKKIREKGYGLFAECKTCHHFKTGICAGGCLAHIINNFSKEEMEEFRREFK